MIKIIKLIYNLIICIFYNEIKILQKRISYLKFFFTNVNLYKYLLFLFNKEINPIKSKYFNDYIQSNKKKWKKYSNNTVQVKNKEKILVENFINHPSYTMPNTIIAKYLQSFYKSECIGILRGGDIRGELMFRSFGIEKFYFYKIGNFFQRLIYIIKSIIILRNIKNTKEFCNISLNKIDLGLTSYDTYMRYTRNPTEKKINFKLIVFFSEALYASDYFDKIYNKSNITRLVQCEKQFVPISILFQKALVKKNIIYTRIGADRISVRIYNDYIKGYESASTFSKKLFNEIFNNNRNKSIKLINQYIKNQIKYNFYGQAWGHYMHKKTRKLWKSHIDETSNFQSITKNNICKIFGWNKKKKIATIFLHNLIDGNFAHGKRTLFLDTCSWVYYLLDEIKKIKNINWIVKLHPDDKHYVPKVNFGVIVKNLEKKYDNIRLFPENLNPSSLKKFTDVALTSHGSNGLEYSSFGIPCIVAERSNYSSFGFTYNAKNISNYLSLLKKTNKIKKLNKYKAERAKVLLFMFTVLIRNELHLIPDYLPNTAYKVRDEDIYWKQATKKLKKFNVHDNQFKKMFEKQLNLKFRHTINLDLCSLKNRQLNDY